VIVAIRDTILTVPFPVGAGLRGLNILLAVWTAVFSAAAVRHTRDHYQRARFTGLALFAAVFAWGTLFKIDSPVTLQVPFFTIALTVSTYGTLGYLRTTP
jgi:hypothetical protein